MMALFAAVLPVTNIRNSRDFLSSRSAATDLPDADADVASSACAEAGLLRAATNEYSLTNPAMNYAALRARQCVKQHVSGGSPTDCGFRRSADLTAGDVRISASTTRLFAGDIADMSNATSQHVLIVDDDEELCQLLKDYLGGEGFSVQTVHDGAQGLQAARESNVDIVILDLMMPVMDGFETLRELRRSSNVPVIMLTARGEEVDRIVGLELGADDYLPKPFNPRELNARVRAILRRGASPVAANESGSIEFEDLRIDLDRHELHVKTDQVVVTNAEFRLIHRLLQSPGHVVTKEQLTEFALGRSLEEHDRSVDVHISNLRKKLGNRHDGSNRIRTIRGVGYLLENTDQANAGS